MSTKRIFEVREMELSKELEMSLEETRRRRWRFLVRGVHWEYVKNRPQLSRDGAEIIRGTRGLVVATPTEKPSALEADGGKARPVRGLLVEKNPPRIEFNGELVVWSVPGCNPRLVVAYVPGMEPTNPLNLVSVFVRDNRNFIKGMKLPGPGRGIRRTRETVFDLVGACPRWRGRW